MNRSISRALISILLISTFIKPTLVHAQNPSPSIAPDFCKDIEVRGVLRPEKSRALSVIVDEGSRNALQFRLKFKSPRAFESAMQWLNHDVTVTGQVREPIQHPRMELIFKSIRLGTPDPLGHLKKPAWKCNG